MRYVLVSALSAIALGLTVVSAEASSVSIVATDLRGSTPQTSYVQKVDYRRCWWRDDGVRVCRWVRTGPHVYRDRNYYYDDPYYYGYEPGYYGRRYYGPGVGIGPGGVYLRVW